MEFNHLKILQANILINAFPSFFPLYLLISLLNMLMLYILWQPIFYTFCPMSVFFFNIIVMVTEYSIIKMNHSILTQGLLGVSGWLPVFSFKQCSLSILWAKSLNKALLISSEITPRSRLTESKEEHCVSHWVTEDLGRKNRPSESFQSAFLSTSCGCLSPVCSCHLYCQPNYYPVCKRFKFQGLWDILRSTSFLV